MSVDMIRVNDRRIPLEDRDEILGSSPATTRPTNPSAQQLEFEEAFARFKAQGRNPKVEHVGDHEEMVVDPIPEPQRVVRLKALDRQPVRWRDGIGVLLSDVKEYDPEGFARVRRSRAPSIDDMTHPSWHGEED